MQIYWGLIRIIFKNCALCALFLPIFVSSAFAQENSTKTDSKKTDTEKRSTKTNNQAVAQGLTVAEALLLNPSPWGFFVSSFVSRGLDEYQDTLDSSNSLDLSYRLGGQSSLNLSLGYTSILYKYDGNLFFNEDPDPGAYGMTDADISYIMPSVWSDKYNRLMVTGGLTLPTSRASIRAGLNAGARVGAILRYRPTSKLIITPSVGTYARSFRYETNDLGGNAWNSPYGVNYGLAASYVFMPWLIGSISYGQVLRYDFNEDWTVLQTLTAQMNITAFGAVNIFTGYRWRDLDESERPLFSSSRSIIYTGVGYAF